jgi:hypothetical protein
MGMRKYKVTFNLGAAGVDSKIVEAEDWRERDGFIEFHSAARGTVWAMKQDRVLSIEAV